MPFLLTNGASTVATISRTFSLLSHSGARTIDRGAIPGLISRELRGAQSPASLFQLARGVPGRHVGRVQTGSTLPLGLSLDQNTGLVYGTLLATYRLALWRQQPEHPGILDWWCGVQGTITIHWDTCEWLHHHGYDFRIGTLQTPYSQNLTSTSANNLVSVSVYRGSLPARSSLGCNDVHHHLERQSPEAGYFDLWIRLQFGRKCGIQLSTSAHSLHHAPDHPDLHLPACVETVPYTQTLQGYGGVSTLHLEQQLLRFPGPCRLHHP